MKTPVFMVSGVSEVHNPYPWSPSPSLSSDHTATAPWYVASIFHTHISPAKMESEVSKKNYKTEPIPTISYKWCQTINIPERRSTPKFPCCVKNTLVDRRVPWKAVIWGNITETSGNIMENPSLFKKLKIGQWAVDGHDK